MNKDSRAIVKKILIILIVSLVVLFLLFPRKYSYLDGGTVAYGSFGVGMIYMVEDRHRIYSEGDISYYETGTVIYIFRTEVYNNAHVDYSHPYGGRASEEEIKQAQEAIEAAMNKEN